MDPNSDFDRDLQEGTGAGQEPGQQQEPAQAAPQEQTQAQPAAPKRSHHKKQEGAAAPAEAPDRQTQESPEEVRDAPEKKDAPSEKPQKPEKKEKPAKDAAPGKELPILEVLFRITHEIACPKSNDQVDAFTGRQWRYRNIEDIQAALKPLLEKYRVVLFSDAHAENVGSHNYIVARVTLMNMRGESHSTTCSVREDEARDGNWASQISGSCDTYAKKMAMQSMFMLCDAALDPDSKTCGRTAAEALQGGTPADGAAVQGQDAPKPLERIYPGHKAWMKLVAKAGLWSGTKDEFVEKVKRNYIIEGDNVLLLCASLPEGIR